MNDKQILFDEDGQNKPFSSTLSQICMSNLNPLRGKQGYLLPSARGGIDAEYAWHFAGGDGAGRVKFIDIEQGWIINHEDFDIKTLPATGINHPLFQDHGAAVQGIILMRNNELGGIGITPNANGYVISTWRPNKTYDIADAIRYAISCLASGDIILIEEQVYGTAMPTCLLPSETEDDIYQAILEATNKGIIVIEAAGNGIIGLERKADLDAITVKGKHILNKSSIHFRDSGSIMVAASTSKPPNIPILGSNTGSRINCFAWGEAVFTAGSFPGSSNGFKNKYTNSFCGTSSATAIVAGVAIAVQSIVEANYHARLSPHQMRKILSDQSLGSRSACGHLSDKIGVMPDLKKIIDYGLPAYFGFFPKKDVI